MWFFFLVAVALRPSLHVFLSSVEVELQEMNVWNASGEICMVKPQMTLNQTEQHRWHRPSSIFHICYREIGPDLVHGETCHLEETEASPE